MVKIQAKAFNIIIDIRWLQPTAINGERTYCRPIYGAINAIIQMGFSQKKTEGFLKSDFPADSIRYA